MDTGYAGCNLSPVKERHIGQRPGWPQMVDTRRIRSMKGADDGQNMDEEAAR